MSRPGPNILLILPIIQELYSSISPLLFKRKSPIILKIKRRQNMNVTIIDSDVYTMTENMIQCTALYCCFWPIGGLDATLSFSGEF